MPTFGHGDAKRIPIPSNGNRVYGPEDAPIVDGSVSFACLLTRCRVGSSPLACCHMCVESFPLCCWQRRRDGENQELRLLRFL